MLNDPTRDKVKARATGGLGDSWHVRGRSVCHSRAGLVRGKGYSGGQEKDWMVHVKEDISAFEMKFEGWRKDVQKAGRWFRQVEEGAESFMRKSHGAERCRAAARHAKAAAAPSTVGIS